MLEVGKVFNIFKPIQKSKVSKKAIKQVEKVDVDKNSDSAKKEKANAHIIDIEI